MVKLDIRSMPDDCFEIFLGCLIEIVVWWIGWEYDSSWGVGIERLIPSNELAHATKEVCQDIIYSFSLVISFWFCDGEHTHRPRILCQCHYRNFLLHSLISSSFHSTLVCGYQEDSFEGYLIMIQRRRLALEQEEKGEKIVMRIFAPFERQISKPWRSAMGKKLKIRKNTPQ